MPNSTTKTARQIYYKDLGGGTAQWFFQPGVGLERGCLGRSMLFLA